jgi:outer membrane protein TolC
LDLIASYSRIALAGTQVTSPDTNPAAELRLNQLSTLAGLGPLTAPGASPGALFGGFGRSLNDLFHRDVPTTEIQLRFSIPLSTRALKANLEESLAEGKRLVFKKKSIEQAIESDVRNALQGIDSARQRLQAARATSVSAEEQFRNEQRRFEMGESTLFLVQQRQLAVVASLSQVNRAEADSSEAISLLKFAQGANYQRHNIDIK